MLGTASTAAQPGAVSPIRGRPEAHPRPAPSTAQIRGATFFEDFESTPVGALPPGWTYYQEGGSLPEAHWFVLSDFGRRIAYSGAEPGDGTPDADWLLAPPVTPQPGDHLVFDSSQGFSEDRGDRFYVLASTTTGAPTAYVDTLAAFTETSLPNYYDPVVLDLAAYAGAPVRLAFVHVSTAADPDEWRIDNVTVRALQQAAVLDAGMVFEEAGLYGPPLPVDRADVNPVATANVRVVGDAGEVDVTGLTFTSEGTTDPEQVTSATLYYTGAVPFIAFPDEGNVVFDQIAGSGPTFAFEGALSLPPGDHYFWLVYTFAEGYRPVYPYPQADAAMVEIVAGGEAIPASVPTLDGSFDIVVAPAPNDSLAQAAEIGPAGGRYGSTTLFATDQLDLGEPSASCTDDGTLDGRNSVWWRFTAPAEGRLTVDLSPSDFNTVLTVLDADLQERACSDDIVPFEVVQSRVDDVPVAAGETVYVRVTGWSLPTLGEAGVVAMDVSFAATVAGEGTAEPVTYGVSAPRPNPASRETTVEVTAPSAGPLVVEVFDVLGRRVAQPFGGTAAADVPVAVVIDVAALPAGAYVMRVRGSGLSVARRLTVAR